MPQTIPNLHWENNTPYLGPAPQDNFYEEEARQQAEGIYWMTRLFSSGQVAYKGLQILLHNEAALARAANPIPGFDALIGAVEQIADDGRTPKHLIWWQRGARPIVKGFESGLTGWASDGAAMFVGGIGVAGGEAVEPAGGGFVAAPLAAAAYVGVSLGMDEGFWPSFNREYLSILGEWP